MYQMKCKEYNAQNGMHRSTSIVYTMPRLQTIKDIFKMIICHITVWLQSLDFLICFLLFIRQLSKLLFGTSRGKESHTLHFDRGFYFYCFLLPRHVFCEIHVLHYAPHFLCACVPSIFSVVRIVLQTGTNGCQRGKILSLFNWYLQTILQGGGVNILGFKL